MEENKMALDILELWAKRKAESTSLFLNMIENSNFPEITEKSRTLIRSKWAIINWYRKVFKKEKYNIEYEYQYDFPTK